MPDNVAIDLISEDILKPIKREKLEIDPFKYEIVKFRLMSFLLEGCYALVRTSGSPVVTEVSEYVSGIYDADGHVAAMATGVLIHVTGSEAFIKLIKYWYEDDPGIYPGDQFVINDPYIGGLHPMDVAVIKPIFCGSEIVGWIESLTHVVEIGAKEPGTMIPYATNIFQEGYRVSGLKIVNRGLPDNTVFKTFERGVRDQQLIHLDLNSKIAHNNVVGARLEEYINKEGPEFFKLVLKKMIYETEDKAREKIKKIPNGRWEVIVHQDTDGLKYTPEKTVHLVCTKKGDKLSFDVSKSSPQSPGGANSSTPGTIGVFFSALADIFLWEIRPWNRGIMNAVEFINPKGTIFNPHWPAATGLGAVSVTGALGAGAVEVLSRFNMVCGFEEDVCAPWMVNVISVMIAGINQFGRYSVDILIDGVAGGTGATSFLDGDNTSAFLLATGTMLSDVEIIESRDPVLFMFRRRRKDSFGHGKFRGGCGIEEAFILHNCGGIQGYTDIPGRYISPVSGIYGGYPADTNLAGWILNSGIKKKNTAEYRKIIESSEEFEKLGEIKSEELFDMIDELKDGDVVYYRGQGGGGYGDPLKREPQMVAKDVIEGLLSIDIAKKIYGVIVDPNTGEVYKEGTRKLREDILSGRKRKWIVRK
jgi:N-methylhydantoinase B